MRLYIRYTLLRIPCFALAALVTATRTILPTRDWPGGGVW